MRIIRRQLWFFSVNNIQFNGVAEFGAYINSTASAISRHVDRAFDPVQ